MTDPAASPPPATRTIVVVGSLNMDLVVHVARAPSAGETLAGRDFATMPGGKGANQAVACARLGAAVAMVGRVGDDAHGRSLRDGLHADGIDATAVATLSGLHTGVAMIVVEDDGQNRIVIAAGANGALDEAAVDASNATIAGAAMLIVQLEVPMASVARAIAIAHGAGVPVLLNPAPALAIDPALWPQIAIVVVNESEAAAMTGLPVTDVASAAVAGRALRAFGAGRALVTLGAQGVVIADAHGERHRAAEVVAAVDTTAAGDTFIGGLAAGLVEGLSLDDAVALGQAASALCVQRVGAQPSIPYRRELPAFGAARPL